MTGSGQLKSSKPRGTQGKEAWLRIDDLLRERSDLKIERPPEIWEVLGGEDRVAELLDAMIRAATTAAASLDELTLNVSNVMVEPPDDDEPMTAPRPGEYVALTITAPSDLGPDGTWQPGAWAPNGVLNGLDAQCRAAGVPFAYVRRIPPRGSLTVFLPRLASKA